MEEHKNNKRKERREENYRIPPLQPPASQEISQRGQGGRGETAKAKTFGHLAKHRGRALPEELKQQKKQQRQRAQERGEQAKIKKDQAQPIGLEWIHIQNDENKRRPTHKCR